MNYFSVPSLLGACSVTSIASNMLVLQRGPGGAADVTPQCFSASCKGAGSFPMSKLCKGVKGFAPTRREGDGWVCTPVCS